MTDLHLTQTDKKLPPILSLIEEGPQHTLRLNISADLHWFDGHFPDAPVLAGIIQLHWAVSLSMALYNFGGVPLEVTRLKFKNIVTPPCELELKLNKVKENEVQFEFSSSGKTHSLGRLIFGQELLC